MEAEGRSGKVKSVRLQGSDGRSSSRLASSCGVPTLGDISHMSLYFFIVQIDVNRDLKLCCEVQLATTM